MKEMHFMIDKNNRLFLSVRSKIHVVQLTDPVAVEEAPGQHQMFVVGQDTPKGKLDFASENFENFHCLGMYDCEASFADDKNDSLRCIIDN